MNVGNVLKYAQEQDIRLWVEDGSLKFDAPRRAFTPAFHDALKQHKADVIENLWQPSDEEISNAKEYFEERAAILEYDYGFTREEAEKEAERRLEYVTCESCIHWAGSSPCGAGLNTSGDLISGVRARLCGFHMPRRQP